MGFHARISRLTGPLTYGLDFNQQIQLDGVEVRVLKFFEIIMESDLGAGIRRDKQREGGWVRGNGDKKLIVPVRSGIRGWRP